MLRKKQILEAPREEGTGGSLVEVLQVNKRVRRKLTILQDVSLAVKPNEFVMVVGQSGGGKTTLVDAIAGYRSATSGRIFVDGVDVYRHKASMRGKIGYVPQRDIIHMELTVYQALDFSAKLRLPPRTKRAERHQRIMEVMEELDLANRRDVRISDLSGGQQKRVSIGVELLTRPRLFFLDEPTSGLDPGNEKAFMVLMRRLADQGRTVIMITHTTKNVMLADRVLFMDRGGYMAWYGPPREALNYFDRYRSEKHLGEEEIQFDDIYAVVEDPTLGGPKDWADRFMASEPYRKYVLEPLQQRQQQVDEQKAQRERKKGRLQLEQRRRLHSDAKLERIQARGERRRVRRNTISALRQFFILSARNITILIRDRYSLILMLLVAPLIGSLDFLQASLVGNNLFDFQVGNASDANVSLFFLSTYALMVGALSQMREFVKEANIYKRERLVNLKILPYITSKIWVGLLLAFYHAMAFTLVHYAAFRMPGGTQVLIEVYITMVVAVMTGMMVGLMASALSDNPGVTPLIMILFVVPMLVLSGGLAPMPTYISGWATTHWSLQALVGINGIGSDVVSDPCWQLPNDLRDALTLDDKIHYGCTCMGVAMFDEDNCNFPGLGGFSVPEVNAPAPVAPVALEDPPVEPELPNPPDPPTDISNQVAVVEYMNGLRQYDTDVTNIQANYRRQIKQYQNTAAIYQANMVQYQQDLADYTIARTGAVAAAEALIDGHASQHGWPWVNKHDPQIYIPWLIKTWLVQVGLMVIYFSIILVLVKRKDAR